MMISKAMPWLLLEEIVKHIKLTDSKNYNLNSSNSWVGFWGFGFGVFFYCQ